jgi:hypothetical protein
MYYRLADGVKASIVKHQLDLTPARMQDAPNPCAEPVRRTPAPNPCVQSDARNLREPAFLTLVGQKDALSYTERELLFLEMTEKTKLDILLESVPSKRRREHLAGGCI